MLNHDTANNSKLPSHASLASGNHQMINVPSGKPPMSVHTGYQQAAQPQILISPQSRTGSDLVNNAILNQPSSSFLKQIPESSGKMTFEDMRFKNESLSRQHTAEINCQTFQRNTPDL